MSILDRLDTYGPAGVESYGDTNSEWYRREDVREALTSDKTKRAIAADLCEHEGVGKACIDCTYKAESVQELLAGGDQ